MPLPLAAPALATAAKAAAPGAMSALSNLIMTILGFSLADKAIGKGADALFGNPEMNLLLEEKRLGQQDSAASLAAMRQMRLEDEAKSDKLREQDIDTAYMQGQNTLIADRGADVDQRITEGMSNPLGPSFGGGALTLRALFGGRL